MHTGVSVELSAFQAYPVTKRMWPTAQCLTSGLAFEPDPEQLCQPSPRPMLKWPLETDFLTGGQETPPGVTLQREDLVWLVESHWLRDPCNML